MERWLQTSVVLLAVCMTFFFWQPSSVSKDGHGKHEVSLLARLGVHAADAGNPHHGRGGNNPNQHNPAQGQGNNQGGPAGRGRGNQPGGHPVSFEPTADYRPPPQGVTFGAEEQHQHQPPPQPHHQQPPAPVSWASLAAGGSGGQQGNNPPAGRGQDGGEVNLPNPSNVRFGNQEIPPPTNEQINTAVSFGPAPPPHQQPQPQQQDQPQPQPQQPIQQQQQEQEVQPVEWMRQKYRPQLKRYNHFVFAITWPAVAQVDIWQSLYKRHKIRKARHIEDHQSGMVRKDNGMPIRMPNMVYTWWYRGSKANPQPILPGEPDFLTQQYPVDNEKCPMGYFTGWPPRNFIIHGLWPNSDEAGDHPEDHQHPLFRRAFPIDEAAMNAEVTLTQELRRVMPDLMSETLEGQDILTSPNPWKNNLDAKNTNNWLRQWYKHGVRAVELAPKVGCSLTTPVAYFRKMVDLYKGWGIEGLMPRGTRTKVGYGKYRKGDEIREAIVERLNNSPRGRAAQRKVQASHVLLKCSLQITDRYQAPLIPQAEYLAMRRRGEITDFLTLDRALYDAEGKVKKVVDPKMPLHQSDWFLTEVYICLDMKSWETIPCKATTGQQGEQGVGDSCIGKTVQIP